MTNEFEELRCNECYEIQKEYPHRIRRIGSEILISEWLDGSGYPVVKLHGVHTKKHRIIAFQFIPNDDPENKVTIDHINRVKTDNRIENLRWCTQAENNRNRPKFQKGRE